MLLGLRENFEEILRDFRIFWGKFQKNSMHLINFKETSEKFWLNLENNEEILGEIWRFYTEIVKRLGKFIRCLGKCRKILKILQGTLREILQKNEK